METRDEFDGVGGRYVIRDGKRVQVEQPTQDHPEGNKGPRGGDGKLLDAPAAPAVVPAAAAPAAGQQSESQPADAADGGAASDKTSKRKGV